MGSFCVAHDVDEFVSVLMYNSDSVVVTPLAYKYSSLEFAPQDSKGCCFLASANLGSTQL